MESIVKMKNMSRRRFFKRAARRMLFSDWVCQIFAFIVVGAFFVGVNHFGTSVGIVMNELTQNELLASFVIYFFTFLSLALVIPMLYGVISFEINAISNEKSVLSDIFCAFSSSESIVRSYSLFFNVFFRCILGFLPAVAVYSFKLFVYEEGMLLTFFIGNVDAVSFVINTLFVIALYLGIVMSSGLFVGIYITVMRGDLPVEDCLFAAKKCLRGNRFEFAKTVISFLPIFVVSLFSMGFLFVMYTIPYMIITFVMFAKYLYEKYNFVLNSVCIQDTQEIK